MDDRVLETLACGHQETYIRIYVIAQTWKALHVLLQQSEWKIVP